MTHSQREFPESTLDVKPARDISRSIRTPKSRVLRDMKWIIFPDNKWIIKWDLLIMALLLFVAFVVPYQVGVSGGRRLLTNMPWLVFNVIINSLFFIDTFLYFWRTYRDSEGRLVLNLKTIRLRYLRTYFIPNILSNLPSTLVFYYLAKGVTESDERTSGVIAIKMMDLMKFARFARVKTILASSDAIIQIKQQFRSAVLELVKYVFLMAMVSHWFACIWSLVAFLQAGNFGGSDLKKCDTWITHWYDSSYEPGGINPIGWTQDLDRYVLSLFWAIQTITSIGYGNISPLTAVEWWIASILMLCSGVMWAYVIGGLVGVAASFEGQSELRRNRIDQANALISEFTISEIHQHSDYTRSQMKDVANRIKCYMKNQQKKSHSLVCVADLGQRFPVLDTLTPQLKRASSLLLMKEYLEIVPYLSSKFLGLHEQSLVATGCIFVEFAAGDIIHIDHGIGDLGRGLFIFQRGLALASRGISDSRKNTVLIRTAGTVFGEAKVLLEDDKKQSMGLMHFLTFSKVVFIPRSVILTTLDRNPIAWKECARWKYFQCLLLG